MEVEVCRLARTPRATPTRTVIASEAVSNSQRAWHTWCQLAGLSDSEALQVVVDGASPLGPQGWIGIIDDWTFHRGRRASREPDSAHGRSPNRTHPDRGDHTTRRRSPAFSQPRLLVQQHCSIPPSDLVMGDGHQTEIASAEEIAQLCAAVDKDELDESGLDRIDRSAFVSRTAQGAVAAACGYRVWPNGVAHLSALTHPNHRRQGHGQRAARGAISRAISEALLPQWRARPQASQHLALKLGLVRVGAQLSLRPPAS